MPPAFQHYLVSGIVSTVIFLCIVTPLVVPLGDGQGLSSGAANNLETERRKNIDGDSQGFLFRIDPHNDLVNTLERTGRAGLTQSPVSRSDARESSQQSEAQPENSRQNREPVEDRERFDDPEAAAEYYRLTRMPTGATELPMERYQAALEHMAKMRRYSTASNQLIASRQEAGQDLPAASLGTWSSLGPGNIGGRTRSIVIDPTNPNTMFAGAVTGGVWKTINAGASWNPTSDLIANLNVSTLAMDPANPGTLYAGTGEELPGWPGNGIFKSANGGASWTQLTATANNSFFFYVKRVVVSPSSSQRVYAATNSGVWRSIDGGTNWTQVLTANISGGCTDLAIRTDATGMISDYIFAACGLSDQATVYRNTSANGAGSWDAVVTEANMGRTSLAIAPSNQNTIYALSADLSGPYGRGSLHAVFRSTTGGGAGSWTARVRNTDANKMNTLLLSYCDGSGSQGFYDETIAVDPVNENRVWVGGINLFRSDDGGANWGTSLSAVLHLDQHAIVFHPQYDGVNNKAMFVGNDGGIFATADATTGPLKTTPCDFTSCPGCVSFISLNHSYASTQFYHGLPYPDGTTYFGGTQDNAVVRGSDINGLNGWSTLPSPLGDGQFVAVDPTNTNTLYANGGVNSIFKSTNGGTSWVSASSGISDSSFFITPLVMDPTNPQRLWTGGGFMWRTANGATNWSQASAALTGGGIATAIVVSPLSADKVWAGASTGFIHRTSAATSSTSATTWLSVQPRTGRVSWLACDPVNSNVVYATYSTFNSLGSDRHVYKSIDGGATWTGIDGTAPNNLPDVPTHTIAVDPTNTQRLYVGTDVGVFSSLDGGANWAVENTGFANVITEALSFNTGNLSTKYLFAFTHGRGAWRVAAPPPFPAIQFSAATYTVNEGAGNVTITVNRSGDLSGASTVDYRTTDTDTFTVNCAAKNGQAFGRCDFATVVGTLSFAATEASKTFTVPIINDGYAEGDETFGVALSNPGNATLGAQRTAAVTINDNETTDQPNPILQTSAAGVSFFVRQHYLDFLGREPEPGEPWSAVLNGCSDQFNTNPGAPSAGCDRITVSGSFFGSPEFKDKGFYVIGMYRVALNRLPTYAEFTQDLASISGATAAEVFAKRAAYANSFVQRAEFTAIYNPGTMSNTAYVNALMSGAQGQAYNLTSITTRDPASPDTGAKITLTTTNLVNGLNNSTLTRAQVLRAIAQSDEITLQAEALNAFVASQYYGYLRRTPDAGGFNSWVNYLKANPNDFRTMVNGFVNSNEYRLRFGPVQ